MLATEILTQDHRDAMELIESLEGVRNDSNGNKERFTKLRDALMLHMQAEEEIYYPALAADEEFAHLMDDNVPEHEGVQENLAQMSELDPGDDAFQQVLEEMKRAIELHVAKEEGDIFLRSIEVLGEDEINDLGNQIDQLKGYSGQGRSAAM